MSGGRDHDDAPGRIPESLIHAALDGEVSDDMQREIADALKYDRIRHAELLETADAIRALRSDVDAPDFAGVVLGELDRSSRFIPASWRRLVRSGRMGVAAALLLSLVCVAGLQRIYPRLTTIGAQQTPVRDVAQAVEADACRVEQSIREEVQVARASMVPTKSIARFSVPGRTDFAYGVALDEQRFPERSISGGFQVVTLPSGYMIFVPRADAERVAGFRSGETPSVSWSRSWVMPEMINGNLASEELRSRSSQPASRSDTALELP